MNHIVEVLIILGVIALIITIFKYPRDAGKTVLSILFLPFVRIWNIILFILFPIDLLISFIEDSFGTNFFTKYLNKESRTRSYKTEGRKNLNFRIFEKFIFLNTIPDQLEKQLMEADETCPEVTVDGFKIHRTEKYSVIELPNIEFYGFSFMIQWLTEFVENVEVYGYADSGRSQFLMFVDKNSENDLIGLTNTAKKFFVTLYDDLDQQQFLRLNQSIQVKTELTTESLGQLIKEVI
ncbi:hypothetical protein [Reichenbachiella versicolor]|uniref:hypothetical protein n=1 Tax=Reichenbachiella versicolor TaxID=1821036 RepID=UPI000D6E1836|nr:hypothetical protein [Reichenbachiella versicolor]